MLIFPRMTSISLVATVVLVGVIASDVVAKDAIQFTGQALDAETGEPIPNVRVTATSVRGDNLKRGQVTWQMHLLKSFKDGSIDFRMKRGYQQTVARIDADGYRPVITPVIAKGKPLKQDFRLSRESIRGIVLTPDGKPAANAQVAMSTWTLEINVEDGRLRYVRDVKKFGREIVKADGDGRFILPAEIDPLTVVAAHESGFTQQPVQPESRENDGVDSTKAGDIDPLNLRLQLQAWGKVSGQLVGVDEKPVSGRTLWLGGGWPGRNDPGHIRHSVTRITDERGKFQVDRMAPGIGSLQQAFENSEGNGSFSPIGLTARFDLKPGQVLKLAPGKIEHPMVGQVVLPEELKDADLSSARFRVFLHDISWKQNFGGPVVTYPGWTKFNASEEGKRYRLDDVAVADAPDRVSFDKDGRFEIRGLPAARYVVQIRVGKGFAVKRFEVPLHSTSPVDIGELKMSIR